eukprot:TRINITY_DN18069_c1_g3_i1.p1 TRINITY_DN18069_c1_g3~~TRINITY_DN18069_c1_g3_i1.p1  ORF type:complete len:585 (+),score=168.44 TRINITY_DN18069_c1_g3_i1:36-1790(+)
MNGFPAGLVLGVGAGVCVGKCLAERTLRQASEKDHRLNERNKLFTELAKEAGMSADIKETIEFILQKARQLVKCEASSLFLVDAEHGGLVSLALSGQDENTSFRVPKSKGIAGYVAANAVPLNVKDAYACQYFNPEFDSRTGFRTKSVLCLPILSHEKMSPSGEQEVIGVVQLLNKCDGGRSVGFTDSDETDLREMTLLASVFLWNSSATQFNRWAEQESSALLRAMNGLSRPGGVRANALLDTRRPSVAHFQEEVLQLRSSDVSTHISLSLKPSPAETEALRDVTTFDVLDYHNDHNRRDLLVPMFVQMWTDLGFITEFGFGVEQITKLCLALRTTYRNVPYHNFAHCFDVTHAVYGFLTKGGLREHFTSVEMLTLMVAAMFHDADHHGLNNQFHLKSKHPSSILLETTSSDVHSVLEIHHCNVAIQVLTDFQVLDKVGEGTQKIWREMISCILATDMKDHGVYVKEAADLIGEPPSTNKLLRMQILLKCADISNLSKPTHMAEKWGTLVQEEFYCQGDKERQLGMEVTPIFDRTRDVSGTDGSLGFLRALALPLYELVGKLYPSLSYVAEGARENERCWASK